MWLAWQIPKMIKHVLYISSKTKNLIQIYAGNANKLPKNDSGQPGSTTSVFIPCHKFSIGFKSDLFPLQFSKIQSCLAK